MTSTTMTPAEANANPFLGRTATTPRPHLDGGTYFDGADLRHRQGQWDAAKSWAAEGAALGEARRVALDAARTEDERRRQQEARADLESTLRARFLGQGHTTAADWERLGPALIDQALLETPDPGAEARAALLKSGAFPRF